MDELPTVIKAGLTAIWAARGGGLKRQLIHKLYNVTLLTWGFSALQNAREGTMTLLSSLQYISLFILPSFFLSLSIGKPKKILTYRQSVRVKDIHIKLTKNAKGFHCLQQPMQLKQMANIDNAEIVCLQ